MFDIQYLTQLWYGGKNKTKKNKQELILKYQDVNIVLNVS